MTPVAMVQATEGKLTTFASSGSVCFFLQPLHLRLLYPPTGWTIVGAQADSGLSLLLGVRLLLQLPQAPLMRLALRVLEKVRLALEPFRTLNAVELAEAGQVLWSLGVVVLLQMLLRCYIGIHLIQSARRAARLFLAVGTSDGRHGCDWPDSVDNLFPWTVPSRGVEILCRYRRRWRRTLPGELPFVAWYEECWAETLFQSVVRFGLQTTMASVCRAEIAPGRGFDIFLMACRPNLRARMWKAGRREGPGWVALAEERSNGCLEEDTITTVEDRNNANRETVARDIKVLLSQE